MTNQAWNARSRPAGPIAGPHLPFTAPLLAGARGRLQKRTLDFILPNPSGGRGAYVVSWAQAAGLASPTLHDTVLAKRLHDLPALTPPAVRNLARAVAAEGYAGRAAAEAANRAQAKIEAEMLRLWSRFLLALIQKSDVPPSEQGRMLAGLGSAGPGVVTEGFVAAARRLGWEPAMLSDALDQLSAAYLPVIPSGRAERLLALLATVHPAMLTEQAHHAHDPALSLALLTRTTGSIAHWLGRAQGAFGDATRALSDPAALLGRWRCDPAAALADAHLVEEVFDGWERICLLWLDADTLSTRLRRLPEIGLLVRLASASLAGEAEGTSPAGTAGAPVPDSVPGSGTQGTGQSARSEPDMVRDAPSSNLVERNERVRARELALEHGDG
jgi:hypothetical protein